MQKRNDQLVFSPSDLMVFLESPFASWMDRWALEEPSIKEQKDPQDALMGLLSGVGDQHELKIRAQFEAEGREVAVIKGRDPDATLAAMRSGVAVIHGGALELAPFAGVTDFLVRVDGASRLGDYRYEVWDAKLSRQVKPKFLVQLCCYAEMLEAVQGVMPQRLVVAAGDGEPRMFETASFQFFYQHLKRRFLSAQAAFDVSQAPDPADSASFGNWSTYAQQQLGSIDHLSQVARITRSQVQALEAAGITTMSALAELSDQPVRKISADVLSRLRQQARLQKESEGLAQPKFELVETAEDHQVGLRLLPPASAQDLFFDLEGYPLEEGGLEYLWGVTYWHEPGIRAFRDFWAHDAAQEKVAFENFVDWAYARWQADPSMHIYHYGNYEIAALKRLMGREGTREHEVDQFLRHGVFVDLYDIVRLGLRIGEPRYSIKNVEHLYREARETDVATGGESVVWYEQWRTQPDGESWESSKLLGAIRDYNRDDCNSTQELVDWLREQQRAFGIEWMGALEAEEPPIPEAVEARTKLRDELLRDAVNLPEQDSERAQILELLAWLLEFHRREDKPVWWRLFDRLGKTHEELEDDYECLAGCIRTATPAHKPTPRSNPVWEYRFDPEQEFKYKKGLQVRVLGDDELRLTLKEFDGLAGLLEVGCKDEPPAKLTLISFNLVNADPIPAAIERVAKQVRDAAPEAAAIQDYLQRATPRFRDGHSGALVSASSSEARLAEVTERVVQLDSSYLTLQGPPGTGKSYTASHVIVELLRLGKCVGIASNSHKAVDNLIAATAKLAATEDIDAQLFKVKECGVDLTDLGVQKIRDNNGIEAQVGPAVVIGTTAWGFAKEELAKQFDYLFVDEAGQVSLANLVAMSQSADNLVILGDQMQLGQPIQGSHPKDSGASVLEYLLGDRATIPEELGVFLPVTYRMHPDVCRFISNAFYDGRLNPAPENAQQVLGLPREGQGNLGLSAGIGFVPVPHSGNTQASDEEIEVVERLVQRILGRNWCSREGEERALGIEDILVVAPYNHQVNRLTERLPKGARVGTVDRFQGQEAPVVILSMCASDASESPRGLDFLLDKHRINVAISRAQSLALVVASDTLIRTPATTLSGMQASNLWARLVEESEELRL